VSQLILLLALLVSPSDAALASTLDPDRGAGLDPNG
jgi:hypothetical protein